MNIIGSFINNYQIVSEVGSGAYGIVYQALDTNTGARVAIKCLSKSSRPPKHHKQSEALRTDLSRHLKQYQNELSNLKQLNLKRLAEVDSKRCSPFIREISVHLKVHNHPNIITIQKILDSQVCIFVIMDYFEEGDMFHNIVELKKYEKKSEMIRSVFIQLCDAISYCHSKNVFHCDIKPENIMCTKDGTKVVIGDFGLSVESQMLNAKTCIGSSYYMPPERLITLDPIYHQRIDIPAAKYPAAAGDLWSLAIILINLTCTRNPWTKANERLDKTFKEFLKNPYVLSSILPISKELYQILCLCLKNNPYERLTLFELKDLVSHCQCFTVLDEEQLYSSLSDTSDYNACESPLYDIADDVSDNSQDEYINYLQENTDPENRLPLEPEHKFVDPVCIQKTDVSIKNRYAEENEVPPHWKASFDNWSVMTNVSFNMNAMDISPIKLF